MTERKRPRTRFSEIREYHSRSFGIFFKAKKVLCRMTSPFQRIEVIENEDYGRVLLLDGLVQTTEEDEFYYHEMLVHPALFCHPKPQNILIIGGGDGGTLRETLRHPVGRVWLVEIDEQVLEVSKRYFPWLKPGLADPRTRLVIGDGAEFIRKTEEKFDIVLIDSSDPVGPSTILHREAFFGELKKRLKPKAIVSGQAGSLRYHLAQHQAKWEFLKRLFKVARFYSGPVPTYPGGTWVYFFLSDQMDPLRKIRQEPLPGLRYYDFDIHRSAFMLPRFFSRLLSKSSLGGNGQ